MWILAPLLLLTSQSQAPQAPEPATGAQQVAPAAQDREAQERAAYLELLGRYNNDVGAHRFDCRNLKRQGVPEDQWPPSPLYTYFDRFVELGDRGNGKAQYWVVANVGSVLEDPAQQRELVQRMVAELVREHASEEYIVDLIDELLKMRRVLGEDYVASTLAELEVASGVAEVEARSLLARASLLWKNGRPSEEGDHEEAVELWRVLVDGYAGTDAAKEAAQYLFVRTEGAMRRAQRSWVGTVRELRSQGVGVEGWPSYPLEAYRGQFEALAQTGHLLSVHLVEVFYPAYEQQVREGIVPTLRFISDDISLRYLPQEWPAIDIKFQSLAVLFEAFPDEDFVYDELLKLADSAKRFEVERFTSLLEPLIASTSVERTRDQAKLVLASSLETGLQAAELERALALYDEVASGSAIERLRKEAEVARREFTWVMPGAQMPNFKARDGEGMDFDTVDYRGKVLVLYFWGFWSPECMADVPWVNGLQGRYLGRPLAILGLNTDTVSYQAYAARTRAAGISWRSSLETKRRGEHVKLFGVWRFPTTIVVDAEGVIRGRGLTHEQNETLIEALLAEVEGGPAPVEQAEPAAGLEAPFAQADRGLRGRVVFDGPRDPLPPLRFSAKQAEGCCAEGHEVDPTDRKRLVGPEGGLANVVVYVEVKDLAFNGRGVVVELDQKECRFEPHVAVVPVGGTLRVKNSDGVSHNVNMNSRYNGRINEMMPASSQRVLEFERGDKVTLGCDVHPWMSSYVFVVETPYWALTGVDGRFEIPDLPPGEYTARYWHEELGELKSERFTIAPDSATTLELEMSEKPARGGRRRPR
jgi:peroxiredoxin/plastocyanin